MWDSVAPGSRWHAPTSHAPSGIPARDQCSAVPPRDGSAELLSSSPDSLAPKAHRGSASASAPPHPDASPIHPESTPYKSSPPPPPPASAPSQKHAPPAA